jgi:Flp pilus assembly protein TadD
VVVQTASKRKIDPYYALAYADLSIAWQVLGQYFLGGDELAAAYGKARSAAQTALSLQPNIPTAHQAMGGVLLFADHNFEQAAAQFRQGEELAPSDVGVKQVLTYLFFTEGRLQEAEDMARKYLALEPIVTGASLTLGRILIARGRYDEAESCLRKGAELQPKGNRWHMHLTNIYLLKGKSAAALKEAGLEPPGFWQDYALALAQQAQGDRAAADAALQKFIEKHAVQGPFQVAGIYALRKEPDQMFTWLERAYEGNDAGLTQLLTAPFIHNYRGDPRFAALCQKLRLPQPQSGIENLPPKS